MAACLVAHYPRSGRRRSLRTRTSSHRPDFLIVGYAPISTNATGRTIIPDKPPLPPPEKQALYEAIQPDVQLLDSPPPTFIVYAANDAVVPVENACRLHKAMSAKGGAAELHVFADAPHGFALREKGLLVRAVARAVCTVARLAQMSAGLGVTISPTSEPSRVRQRSGAAL